MNTQTTFSIFFIVFASIMIFAGIYSKRWVSEASDYILAGREVSLLINIMGVAAIGFAGTTVSLVPGYAITYGIKGALMWGFIYSCMGLILYGQVFSNFIRRCSAQTLPEYLEMRFDSKVRSIVSYGTIFGLCGILANNIVSCVVIVVGYVGWTQWLVITLVFGIILIFTYISGLWATTITDFFQVTVGVIAVPTFLALVIKKFGGMEYLQQNWLGTDVFSDGITSARMGVLSMEYPSALTFTVLFGAALVWGNNYYWMKIASCRNEKIARSSFTIAGLLLICVFMIPLAFIGAYAGASMPEIFTLGGGKVAPVAAYGVLAGIFPPLLASFLIIGSVAASISTASTSALGATSTATRDIYQRVINPNATSKSSLKASKIIMLLVGFITWALCFFPGGPTYLFAFANAWLVPPAVLLCLGILWPRFNSKSAFWAVLVGMTVMSALTLLELLKIYSISQWTHLALVGFTVTLVVAIIMTYCTVPKYYGRADWNYKFSENVKRETAIIKKQDIEVLLLIQTGHKYMADITDALGVDSKTSNESIEILDRCGYIERAGLLGASFYEFKITEKATTILPVLSEQEVKMLQYNLNSEYIEFLKVIATRSDDITDYIKQQRSLVLLLSLVREGYILEKGIFKRKIKITLKGKELLNNF